VIVGSPDERDIAGARRDVRGYRVADVRGYRVAHDAHYEHDQPCGLHDVS